MKRVLLEICGGDAPATGAGTPKSALVYCPGCKCYHAFTLVGRNEKGGCWSWNGDVERPTFSPSMLVLGPGLRCHSFVRDGVWEYLSDCDHELAGQRVPIPPED